MLDLEIVGYYANSSKWQGNYLEALDLKWLLVYKYVCLIRHLLSIKKHLIFDILQALFIKLRNKFQD